MGRVGPPVLEMRETGAYERHMRILILALAVPGAAVRAEAGELPGQLLALPMVTP